MASSKVSCTPVTIIVLLVVIFLRLVTMGYLVLGFVLKYHERIFSETILSTINRINLGGLSLGTTIDGLTLSPTVHFVLHSVVGVLGVVGVAFGRKLLMAVFTVYNLITCIANVVYLVFYSWVLSQIENIKGQMLWKYNLDSFPSDWIEFFNRVKCAGVTGQNTPGWWYNDQIARGCYDLYRDTLRSYLSCFITLVIIHIIGGIILIYMTEIAYRQKNISQLEKRGDIDTIWKFKFGMYWELKEGIVQKWKSDKVIFLSSVTVSIFTIANYVFWATLFILFVGEYRDSSMWTALSDVTRNSLRIGRLAMGISISFLILIPLDEIGKAVYFVGVHKCLKPCIAFFTGLQIFLILSDVMLIVMVTYILKVYYDCPYWDDLYFRLKEICYHTDSLYIFVYVFLAFSISRIVFHIIQFILSDRIYKRIQINKTSTVDQPEAADALENDTPLLTPTENQAQASGCIWSSCVFSVHYCKRSTFRAVTVGVNVFIIVWTLTFWLGIITVHYGFEYHSTMQAYLGRISNDNLNLFYVDRVLFWFLAICLPITVIAQIVYLHGLFYGRPRQVFVSLLYDVFNVILFIILISLSGIFRKLSSCCGKNANHFCQFSYYGYDSLLDTSEFCSMSSYLPVYTKRYSTTLISFLTSHLVLMIMSLIIGDRCYKHTSTNQKEEAQGPFYKYIAGPIWIRMTHNRFINPDKMLGNSGRFGLLCLINVFFLTILDIVYFTLLLIQYIRNPWYSDFTSTLNAFEYSTYTFGDYYRGLAVSIIVLVPLQLLFRLFSSIGFMIWKNYVILATLPFIVFNIVLLGLSGNLLSFGECCDSLICSFSKYTTNQTAFDEVFCLSYDDTVRMSMEVTLTYLTLHITFGILAGILAISIIAKKKNIAVFPETNGTTKHEIKTEENKTENVEMSNVTTPEEHTQIPDVEKEKSDLSLLEEILSLKDED